MKSAYRLLIVIVIVALLVPFLSPTPTPAHAQSTRRWDFQSLDGWYYDDDFHQDGDDNVQDIGTIVNYADAEDDWAMNRGGWNAGEALTAVYDFGHDITVSEWSIRIWVSGILGRWFRVRFYSAEMNVLYEAQYSIADTGWHTPHVTDLQFDNVRYIVIHVHADQPSYLDWFEIGYTGDPPPTYQNNHFVRPLMPDDALQIDGGWNDLFIPDESSAIDTELFQPGDPIVTASNNFNIIYRSQHVGAFVHAAAGGIVQAVTPVTESDCQTPATFADLGDILTSAWTALLNYGVDYAAQELSRLFGGAANVTVCTLPFPYWLNSGFGYGYYFFPTAAQIVSVLDLETQYTFYYLVTSATVMPQQMIQEGCAIGKTIPVFEAQALATMDRRLMDWGAGAIWAVEGIAAHNLALELDIYPWTNESCGLPSFGDCANLNPYFADPGTGSWVWSFDGTTDRNPVGATQGLALWGNGQNNATQTFIAPTASEQYSIKLVAHVEIPDSDGSDSEVIITLGDTSKTFVIPASGESVEYVTDLDTYTDSDYSGAVYDLRVEAGPNNEASSLVVVEFLCADNDADPVSPVVNCVFSDSGFSGDPVDAWALIPGGPNTPEITEGALQLPPYTRAEQVVDLSQDTYTLDVNTRALPQAVPPLNGYSISVDWRLLDGDGTTVLDSGTITGDSDLFDVSTDEIVLPGDVSGTFVLDATNSTDTAQIDYVCLTPQNLPTAPPVPDYPTALDCNSCPRTLVGDLTHDIPEMVQWMDCRIRQLYYCDARKIMIDTRDGVNNTVRGIGMTGRWLGIVFEQQVKWFWGAFGYIAGYLNNVALSTMDAIAWQRGGSTTIIQGTPLGFWDILGLLITGLRDVIVSTLETLVTLTLNPIVGMLMDAILSVINVISSLIDYVLTQVDLIRSLFTTILTAINEAEPQTIPGAPDCTQPDEFICLGFYILDNTVFAGPAQYPLPLVLAAAALNLLVWAFDRFRRAFASI